jgi:hypothetical protein
LQKVARESAASDLVLHLVQVKALALGAKGVGLGRSFLYANACYGEEGVQKIYESESDFDNNPRNRWLTYYDDSPSLGSLRGDGHVGSAQDFGPQARDGAESLVARRAAGIEVNLLYDWVEGRIISRVV